MSILRIYNVNTGNWEVVGGGITEVKLEDIPDLPASKITSGTLSVDRIPNLPANKITSGTLSVDRIPNLPANKITSGDLRLRNVFQLFNGEPRINLGDPSLTEMALFEEEYSNKTAFYPIDRINIETYDGTTWSTLNVTDGQKKRLVGGDSYANINIPSGVNQFRITIRNKNRYVFLGALYAYINTQRNSTAIEIWKKRDDGDWEQHTNSNKTVSGVPVHVYLPFPTILFFLGSTAGYYQEVRILFKPVWNNTNSIILDKLQLWGGYPAEKRRVYSVDENQNVNFPGKIRAYDTDGYKDVVLTNDTRLTDARPASDVYAWAKQPNKPSYTYGEVGAAPANHTHPEYYTEAMLNTKFAGLGYDSALQKLRYDTGGSFPYVASENWVEGRISQLINGAPAALDTLKELADALGDNNDAISTITNTLANKVDKVAGKGLSTNDFTAPLKTKLDGIEAGANKYNHPSYTPRSNGLYKIEVDAQGHVSNATPVNKADIVSLGIPAADTNNYVTNISGSGNGTITLTRNGLASLSLNLSHTHPEYVTSSSGTAYNSTRWDNYRIRVGSYSSGASGYITFSY